MDDNKKKLIADWHRRCRQSQRLNYITGDVYLKYHYIVGIFSIILTTIASSAYFIQISSQQANGALGIIAGILSILVGILSALQTFFRFSEKAEKYKAISAKYSAVRRHLELLITQNDISKAELDRQLDTVRKEMDELASSSLTIPQRIKNAQVAALKAEARKNELFTQYDNPGQHNQN